MDIKFGCELCNFFCPLNVAIRGQNAFQNFHKNLSRRISRSCCEIERIDQYLADF